MKKLITNLLILSMFNFGCSKENIDPIVNGCFDFRFEQYNEFYYQGTWIWTDTICPYERTKCLEGTTIKNYLDINNFIVKDTTSYTWGGKYYGEIFIINCQIYKDSIWVYSYYSCELIEE